MKLIINAVESQDLSEYFRNLELEEITVRRSWIGFEERPQWCIQKMTAISEPEIKFYMNPKTFQMELRKVRSWKVKSSMAGSDGAARWSSDIPVDDKQYSSLDSLTKGNQNEHHDRKIQVRQGHRFDSYQEPQAVGSL